VTTGGRQVLPRTPANNFRRTHQGSDSAARQKGHGWKNKKFNVHRPLEQLASRRRQGHVSEQGRPRWLHTKPRTHDFSAPAPFQPHRRECFPEFISARSPRKAARRLPAAEETRRHATRPNGAGIFRTQAEFWVEGRPCFFSRRVSDDLGLPTEQGRGTSLNKVHAAGVFWEGQIIGRFLLLLLCEFRGGLGGGVVFLYID